MFYSDRNDERLRLGDIVRGFACGKLLIDQPFLDGLHSTYHVEVCHRLAVVLSPCCAIRDGYIQLAPLQQIEPKWYRNERWLGDLTVVNAPMDPEEALPPQQWQMMSPSEQAERKGRGKSYTLADYFVYAPHVLLGEYEVGWQKKRYTQGHYAVDFRGIACVKCAKIELPETSVRTKILQLSKETRGLLRDKMAYYYGNPPEEDKP